MHNIQVNLNAIHIRQITNAHVTTIMYHFPIANGISIASLLFIFTNSLDLIMVFNKHSEEFSHAFLLYRIVL